MSIRSLAFVLIGILGTAVARGAEGQTYAIDPTHSQPLFEISHMGYSLQRGNFAGANGTITLDRAAKQGSIDVTIDARTVRAIDSRLETQLRAEDFFNVARYPTMSFKSTELAFEGDRLVGADGTLTMLGITKPVKLKVDNFICGPHPYTRNPMCGAEVTTTIKRSAWGMTYGIPKAIADDVKITIPVEAYRQ